MFSGLVKPSGDFDIDRFDLISDCRGDGPTFLAQLTFNPQGCLVVELNLLCSDVPYELTNYLVGVLSNYDTHVFLPPSHPSIF